jgi:hypothetical protein
MEKRIQYLAFCYLSFVVVLLALILFFVDASPFHRFFGSIHPLLVLLIAIITGGLLVSYLIGNTQFSIYQKHPLQSYLVVIGLAALFGIEIVAADVWLVECPADINILFPKSLLFYPVIAYVVEVFFHLFPISLLMMSLSWFRKWDPDKISWFSILTVSLLEPLYQVWFTSSSSSFTSIYTGIHVFLFSLTQLLIFKRLDFLSMFLFRIVFYVIWHVLWGHFRLDLLF